MRKKHRLIKILVIILLLYIAYRKISPVLPSESSALIDQAKEQYQQYSEEFVEEANEAIGEAVESAVESAARSFWESITESVQNFVKGLTSFDGGEASE